MSLSAGTKLGTYEVLTPLGAGGMGEVYRAKDTRLERIVAIKALPAHLATDPDRLSRFEREAKVLAILNHPNIGAIYGLEEVDGHRYLVLEFVEGQTLAERLKRGAIPIDEALPLTKQIAEALEAAHEKGVIHRDLKPGNVMLTSDGRVKVLDFGLARTADGTSSTTGTPVSPASPTVTSPAMVHSPTIPGVIMGTAGYMSPEQARGRPVDKRSDIFSFGCVLYEMLAGAQPFRGETVADSLGATLHKEFDLSLLPPGTPLTISRLLCRCLTKDRNKRLHDIADARIELELAIADPTGSSVSPAGQSSHQSGRRMGMFVVGAALAGILATLGGYRLLTPAVPPPMVRKFNIPVPRLIAGFDNSPRISQDGRHIVYSSGPRIWIRDLQRFEATEVPGSEDSTSPFWSFDGMQIGFAKEKRIWAWPLTGGQSTPICTIPDNGSSFNHATWGEDGKIYFATFRGGLYEVAAAGGNPRLILSPDSTEVDFHHPHLLPDGKHLVTVAHRKAGPHPIVVISLPGGERKNLQSFDALRTVSWSPTGHLFLVFDDGRQQILAAPFSESKLEITGEPFLVSAGGQHPSVSANGLMVYYLGSSHAMRELAWVDREGRVQQVIGQPQRGLDSPALSSDDRRVAVVAYETDNADIWIHDMVRGTRRRLVSGPQNEISPSWAPSGDRILYESAGNVQNKIMETSLDGEGPPKNLADGQAPAISPDGLTLVFQREEQGYSSLWRCDLKSGSPPTRLSPNVSQQEDQPKLSPDGKWIAYLSDEAGRNEVFVRRFADGAQKQQVSLNGGAWPFWSRSSNALYYWERDVLMEVPIKAAENLALEAAHRLFSASDVGLVASPDSSSKPAIDIAADGRFLIVRRSSQDPLNGILVVENWFEEFRKR